MATHFSDTDGPGCIVCSENLKSSTSLLLPESCASYDGLAIGYLGLIKPNGTASGNMLKEVSPPLVAM